MNEVHFTAHNMLSPPAVVREAFDERQLKAEWDDACADEQDAVSRKQAVLRKALARWPMVPCMNPRNGKPMPKMRNSLEMRRFVRDVLGMPDRKDGTMNGYASQLLTEGWREKAWARSSFNSARNVRIKNAVVELVAKYRCGADPAQCMEALAKFYEEQTDGKA